MNKLITSFLFFACSLTTWAQFSAANAGSFYQDNSQSGLDALFVFNGITSATEITYTGSEPFTWLDYSGAFLSTSKTIYPDHANGYILEVNGVRQYLWVIDYQLVKPVITAVDVADDESPCEYLKLIPTMSVPEMFYVDRGGAKHTLLREFKVLYYSPEWMDEAWSDPKIVEIKKNAPFADIWVDAPLGNTTFTLTGDQWADLLQLDRVSFETSQYDAVAVQAYPRGIVSERDAKNEVDRKGSDDVSGSAPLVVDFTSNANNPQVFFYEWFISGKDTPDQYIRYTDKDFRYTFAETGGYWVKLKVTSSVCEFIDSVEVTVSESLLEVPNIFTPNGDGVNDEFRVAYKSLSSYYCQVMNRWGRILFTSKDPGKGWDGKVNGKPAAAGTYYYIIEAVGTDRDKKGNFIKYKKSGDINLIR